jgi:sugar/nucleoside kinase (ribokinase family)
METSEVLCYGEIGIDNIIQADGLPSPENAIFPKSDSYHGGGAASNTAVWLTIDVKVKLTGNMIGRDPYGDLIMEGLQRQPNIDLSLVEQREGVTTPFTRAIVTPDGERSFLIFWYPQAPKVRLTEEMLEGVRYLALDLYGGPERLATAKLAFEAGVSTAIGDVISTTRALHQHCYHQPVYTSEFPRRGSSPARPKAASHIQRNCYHN